MIHPDRGISKIQRARYYERIAGWIVPHVAGRPLTLVHCPAGIAAPCHFDPWKDYWQGAHTISAASFAAVTRV